MSNARALLFLPVLAASCSFNSAGLPPGVGQDGPAGAETAPRVDTVVPAPDGTPPDTTAVDISPADQAPQDAKPDTTPSCVDGTFECLPDGTARICGSGLWQSLGACPLGCAAATKSCRVPSNGVAGQMHKGTKNLGGAGWGSPISIDTDTGKIVDPTTTIRPAGAGLDAASGIHYAQQNQASGPKLGVFSVKDLDLPTGVTVTVTGSRALVILASGKATVAGLIDLAAEGELAGPGGSGGGDPGQSGSGTCAGKYGAGSTALHHCNSGGGGGGHGGNGGGGGDCSCPSPDDFKGGAAGANTCGVPGLVPLSGGSGGAGGTKTTGSTITNPGPGGGGGGALQISAKTSVAVTSSGRINVGGGGGGESINAGGAGGGAGGAILLEAPAVTVAASGVLAANGGGGGGGD